MVNRLFSAAGFPSAAAKPESAPLASKSPPAPPAASATPAAVAARAGERRHGGGGRPGRHRLALGERRQAPGHGGTGARLVEAGEGDIVGKVARHHDGGACRRPAQVGAAGDRRGIGKDVTLGRDQHARAVLAVLGAPAASGTGGPRVLAGSTGFCGSAGPAASKRCHASLSDPAMAIETRSKSGDSFGSQPRLNPAAPLSFRKR